MRRCEFCGEELINPNPKQKHCKKRDNRKCYSQRTAAQSKKNQLLRAKKRNKRCPICGKLLIRKDSKTCSPKCTSEKVKREALAAKLKKQKEALDIKLNKTIFEWPFKMPLDKSVTPADMCPLI